MMKMYLGVAALVGVLSLAPAFAQQTSEPTGSAQTGGNDLATPTIIEAMSGDGAGIVTGMASGAKVTIVPLPTFSAADQTSIESSMTQNEARIAALRTAARSNAAVQAALAARNIDADRVVAVRKAANGDLIVYTRSG